MTLKVICLIKRNPALTPAQFRDHYDNVHMPMVRELTGQKFPLVHKRSYLTPVSPDDPTSIPHILMGDHSAGDFNYDAYAELIFEDMVAFTAFTDITWAPGNNERIETDAQKFLVKEETRVALVEEEASVLERPKA